MDLAQKKCVACEGGVAPMTPMEAEAMNIHLKGWTISPDSKKISKTYSFPDFAQALAFTNTVGAIAEGEGHHPDIALSWGKVGIELTTHAIKGLSENDFIVAAKIDAMG